MPSDIDREKYSLLRSDWREQIKEGIGSGEKERKHRQKIRERVQTGLYDFAWLNQYMRNDDIRQIFKRKNSGNAAEPNQDIDERATMLKTHWVAARHMVVFLWHGLRLNGMDKNDIFEKVIIRGIEDGESDYNGVPHGMVESKIRLDKLEAIEPNKDIDPVEKLQRGLSLSGDDLQEINDRLSKHPEVDSIIGENVKELVREHLID